MDSNRSWRIPSPSSRARTSQLSESTLRALGGEKKSPHRRLPSSVSSRSSLRSRLESETDDGEIHSPKPRHSYHLVQPWLFGNDQDALQSSIPRPSSPLRPGPPPDRMSFSSLGVPSPTIQTLQPRLHPKFRTLDADRMDSVSRRWVRWMGKVGMKDATLPISIAASVCIRWTVGLAGYSGSNTPPMFGDYEAQRHWMETTLHLPLREWYFYDLAYWGLDYPPLTAYVSWVCGYVGHMINPSWFAMDTSRGFESPASKTYMRSTVLVLDLIVYIPAITIFARTWWAARSKRTQSIALLTILFQPALILIDNGHFQYNSVMLGLTVWSINLFQSGHDLLGAAAFVLSLGFKQMALYYSPAIFAYLLGKCLFLGGAAGRKHFVAIAIASTLTFFALFAPFLQAPFPETTLQPWIRMFPFSRGLFEDKVANFWCASNVIIKWRERVWAYDRLSKMALGATLIGILPSTLHLLTISWITRVKGTAIKSTPAASKLPSPAITLLLLALFNSSLAFFLFSFQVHEKSILLPLLPLTLLMSARDGTGLGEVGTWEWGVLFNNVAVFSMWPLLKKDGQALEYATLVVLWNYLIGYVPTLLPSSPVKMFSLATYASIGLVHLAEMIWSPPRRYPDLYPVLNVLLCTPVFGLTWLWGMKRQLEVGWAITSLRGFEPRARDMSNGPRMARGVLEDGREVNGKARR